jgi:exonuclease SbcC
LELEGFTAFRERVEIDFSDAELFVLVGPTGSGKSSIIDAITFALYGSIPRLRKGRVEPIISLGAHRARIRFEFSVAGTRYSATRVVQRTRTGATTSEARLEGGTEDVIGATELTEAVERLLGLSYEHFTKSVVLPQGKFASFLLGGSSDRQALLRELLDLGRYAQVRDLAVQRAQSSEARAEALKESLVRLEEVTPGAIAELETAERKLAAVTEWSAGERTRLAAAKTAYAEAEREVTRLVQLSEGLERIEIPDGLTELDDQMTAALAERSAATDRVETASREVEHATAAATAAGDPAEVARLIGLTEQAEKLATRIADGFTKTSEIESSLAAAVKEEEKLGAESDRARTRLERLNAEHAAHALRSTSAVGDPCPVCHRPLQAEHLADSEQSGSISEATQAASEAAEAGRAASARRVAFETQLEQFRSQLARLESEQSEIFERLARQTRPELETKQAEIAAARARLDSATNAVSRAREAANAAESRVAATSERAAEYWSALDRHRMEVTSLNPPEVMRRDLGKEWSGFLQWRDKALGTLTARLDEARVSEARQAAEIESAAAAITERIVGAGVELVAGSDPHEQALMARARIAERAERMRSDLDTKIEATAALEGYEGDAIVARALSNHLKVNGFERWLIEEVVHDLVVHANERLDQLSDGAYALAVEKSEFVIIDRLNADERRTPETLSGGETFVVSLALALSLADQMAAISLSGTARLESVFLDEGFGTLDAETLDTVAAVIHELGSDGRTVGLITHVSELAQQIPIRFEVSKRPGGARVERVEA